MKPHIFGERCRELLQQQRVVTLPRLQLLEVLVTFGTNPITAAEKELKAKLLPPSDDGE